MLGGTTALHRWDGLVRFDSFPLAALSGTSGAILVSSILVAAANGIPSANAGRTTGKAPSQHCWGDECSSHSTSVPNGCVAEQTSCPTSSPGLRNARIAPANAGRTTRKEHSPAREGEAGCSNHPGSGDGARSSEKRPANRRRRGWCEMPGECRPLDYRGRIASPVAECVR
jgi:hypothetical protein